ncbi:MAG: Ig-like domain-containing protein [Gemmatimonadetes bacterium]|nr:Ig-like domain-containing protein [Gemmatimonadota bacterium]
MRGASGGALALVVGLAACGGGARDVAAPVVPVGPPVLTSISISIASNHILKDRTTQVTASPRDQNGAAIAAPVTFSSSDASTASVDATGQVYGVNPGTATILAKSGSVSSGVQVLVTLYEYPLAATVETGAASFAPAQVDVHVGGAVSWQFNSVAHTVIFDAVSGAPQNIPTTHDLIVTRTFSSVGTFGYQCNIHAGMTGVVVVHPTA